MALSDTYRNITRFQLCGGDIKHIGSLRQNYNTYDNIVNGIIRCRHSNVKMITKKYIREWNPNYPQIYGWLGLSLPLSEDQLSLF